MDRSRFPASSSSSSGVSFDRAIEGVGIKVEKFVRGSAVVQPSYELVDDALDEFPQTANVDDALQELPSRSAVDYRITEEDPITEDVDDALGDESSPVVISRKDTWGRLVISRSDTWWQPPESDSAEAAEALAKDAKDTSGPSESKETSRVGSKEEVKPAAETQAQEMKPSEAPKEKAEPADERKEEIPVSDFKVGLSEAIQKKTSIIIDADVPKAKEEEHGGAPWFIYEPHWKYENGAEGSSGTLQAKRATFLKTTTAMSWELEDAKKRPVSAGATFHARSVSEVKSPVQRRMNTHSADHREVVFTPRSAETLVENHGDVWYICWPHWTEGADASTLKAKQSTWLKRSVDYSWDLKPGEKIAVPENETIAVRVGRTVVDDSASVFDSPNSRAPLEHREAVISSQDLERLRNLPSSNVPENGSTNTSPVRRGLFQGYANFPSPTDYAAQLLQSSSLAQELKQNGAKVTTERKDYGAWDASEQKSSMPLKFDFESKAALCDAMMKLEPREMLEVIETLAEFNPTLLGMLRTSAVIAIDPETKMKQSSTVVQEKVVEKVEEPVVQAVAPPKITGKRGSVVTKITKEQADMMIHKAASKNSMAGLGDQDPVSSSFMAPLQPAPPMPAHDNFPVIIQFGMGIFYCKEGEHDKVCIELIRLGPEKLACSCDFMTQDASAKAGKRYVASKGKINFGPGENMQQIYIDILADNSWDATLEFKVILSNPTNAVLGKHLHTCVVKVIDSDWFPTDRFSKELAEGKVKQIPTFQLLEEYFKFNRTANPIITKGSVKMVACDTCKNLYFIMQLYIMKQIVDGVIGEKCHAPDKLFFHVLLDCPDLSGDAESVRAQKEHMLFGLMVIIVCPMAFVHYFHYRTVFMKVGGTSRKVLQANLVRKYLNYDETSRAQLGPSNLIMALTRDVHYLVHNGYMQLFPLAMNFGRLLLMLALQLYMGTLLAILPVVIIPILLFTFLGLRNPKTTAKARISDENQNIMISHVSFIAHAYQMILDYSKKSLMVEKCEKMIAAFNWSLILADAVTLNNRYFAPWLSLLAVASWLLVGGVQVIEDPDGHTLGEFITTVEIFKEVGMAWGAIYEIMLLLQDSLPYIQRIVTYMNLKVDVEKRMRLCNEVLETAGHLRNDITRQRRASKKLESMYSPAADEIPIRCKNLTYMYKAQVWKSLKQWSKAPSNTVGTYAGIDHNNLGSEIYDCNIEFPQGSFVTIVGPPGEGKAMVLKLVGGQLLPDHGYVMIPPHLRVLHISKDPMFFVGTLMANLTYGLEPHDAENNPQRVQDICRKMQVAKFLMPFLDPEQDVFKEEADWGEVLDLSQQQLLSLVRALVASPEVLVIHKPTLQFDDRIATITLRVLREFINGRGLQLPPEEYHSRRPRTVLITTVRTMGVELADHVFCVTNEGAQNIDSSVGAGTGHLDRSGMGRAIYGKGHTQEMIDDKI